jgi:hypothetical protein
MKTSSKILPMRAAGIQHLIERTYRESGKNQWVRETYANAAEAGATKIVYGIEWQAAHQGVFRRTIWDDGCGMTKQELVAFFDVIGAGGKAVGGRHENFGVGAKTSLMPWNRHGVVVMSWKDGVGSMVWICQDEATGEYGLRNFNVETVTGELRIENCVPPFLDQQEGIDWRSCKPAWVTDHGTGLILLGDKPDSNTVLGAPGRQEDDLKGIASYLNRRIWEPKLEVVVEEFRSGTPETWPRQPGGTGEARTVNRTVAGARHYVEYPTSAKGGVAASGDVTTEDGTKLRWWLWRGERPGIHSYAPAQGYIAALYRGELYDVSSHISTYRSFGVTAPGVRSRLWIVAEPPEYKDGSGAYPRTDRNALLVEREGAPAELPWADWGAEFADRMPEAIRDALAQARQETGGIDDPSWRARLAARLGVRWRFPLLHVIEGGDRRTTPESPGSTPVIRISEGGATAEPGESETAATPPQGTAGDAAVGSGRGKTPARLAKLAAGIPSYRVVTGGEVEHGVLAAWQPNAADHPEGLVLINADHPVLREELKHWSNQYPAHAADAVEHEVLAVYGEVAVAKVAHSEKLRALFPGDIVERELRSDYALTMSLLGLLSEEALISQRLAGKVGRRQDATKRTGSQ